MAAIEGGDKPKYVDMSSLSVEDVMQLKQDLGQEIQNIQESLQTLYNCKAKYASSKEALETFQPEWQDRPILVPLTSSMYVPGRIKDLDNFVIDVGTGYYAEKSLEGSKDYFNRRVKYVQEQIEKIEIIRVEKCRLFNAVVDALESVQAEAMKQMQRGAAVG